jgi:diguanylate cyclase (GGDEF)-like protein
MADPAANRTARYRTLLIEDRPEVCALVSKLLNDPPDSPFAVESTHTLADGLARISEGNVDVLLLDLDLPDSKGLDTCTRAVAHNLTMPIVVLSDRDDPVLSIEVLGRGAQDFLVRGELEQTRLVRALRYAIQRHAMQAALQHLSLMDDLTGLYNRRGFIALAEQQMKLAQRAGRAMTLAFADLDSLKGINDKFGHAAGDEAILRAAEALRKTFRNSDIIGRMGGDEFTVLLVDASDDSRPAIDARLRRILNEINERVKLPFEVSVSLGTARFEPDLKMSVEELLEKADKSLYMRKRARKRV